MERRPAGDAVLQSRLDAELLMVREAIALVASQRSPRVTVPGLRLGEAILEPAGRIAGEAAVRLVPLWTADDHHLAFRIEGIER